MDAPPIQYATTIDGWKIAWCLSGEGAPLVFLPVPFNHLRNDWTNAVIREFMTEFVTRFRLVRFDARGMGMSQRGLPDTGVMDRYLRDLDCVIERSGLDRVSLMASYIFWRTAVRYAALHPERVHALVLWNPDAPIEDARNRQHPFEVLARDHWDSFLIMLAGAYASVRGDVVDISALKASVTQSDYLKMLRALMEDDASPYLSQVSAPTLILTERQPGVVEVNSLEDVAQKLASALRNSQLVLFEGLGQAFRREKGHPSEGFRLIEDFLRRVQDRPGEVERPTRASIGGILSAREIEVLRLLAAGRSNQQIADELVISLNTVRRHVSNIFDKTGVTNRAQATAYAKDHGLA
jgi:DNA-binding NarL/FixJ family response regulator